MARRRKSRPPGYAHLRQALNAASQARKPVVFIVAGHNGSGKSTLWYERLAPRLKIPLINADRLMLSILPPPKAQELPAWAQSLRDTDERWQRLSQQGVQVFTGLIMSQKMPFAFETVFSHWQVRADGTIESKADIITALQKSGYFVVLLFVGLTSADLSVLRVETRRQQGGHSVPKQKLKARFPRTQQAVRHAAPLADRTLMFDNSQRIDKAFSLVRAQRGRRVLYDCRSDPHARRLCRVASIWLNHVAPLS